MKYLTIFASLVLAVCMLCSFVPTKLDTEIYTDTVRLHVLANSDDPADQAIKLAVRDAVLAAIGDIIENASSAPDALEIISENLDYLRATADSVLTEIGTDDRAEVVLSKEYYPTKDYGSVSLPAGTYSSLQIRIGKAEGKNWWCVLYPQLCTSTASTRETLIRTGFSSDQIELLTGNDKVQYKIKFKLLEIFG
jgi:stage II sporulation protein R